MRPKSVPLSVRVISSRPSSPTTTRVPAGPSRRRWRDVFATLVMVALVPAITLPNSNADATIGPPTITAQTVARNATGISIFSRVAVRFDRPVTGVGRGTFVLRDSQGRIIPATIGYDSTMLATLLPNDVLRPNSLYQVALSGSIRDASGTSLRWISWSFRTGTQPSAGVRFAPWRDVQFDPGTVTGIRIDGRGAVISTKVATLARRSWAAASGRATINGKTYLLIANGIWAGHYVPRGAIGAVQAKAVVAPAPSTPTPTSTPAATPSQGGSPTPVPVVTPRPVPTPTPTVPVATPTPGPPVVIPPTSGSGIVISSAEIAALPTSGAAWDALKRAADSNAGSPNLADRDQTNDVYVLAKALVYARTGTASYRSEVIAALRAVIGTEAGAIHLAVGRGLAAYVISADLVGLRSADPAFDATFRGWLSGLLDLQLVDGSLTDTHERRPNNHGLHAGASRAAVAAYLGDSAELARVATVFRGWTGERGVYAGFNYGELDWQANPAAPVGINPPGTSLGGHSVDGTLPDEQRRTGGFSWPPPCGSYPHEAVDGALLTAEILSRAGYPAYSWGSNALLRAEQWLWNTGCPPSGDNVWNLPMLDARYGSNFWNGAVVRPGKNFGWTDWLYGS